MSKQQSKTQSKSQGNAKPKEKPAFNLSVEVPKGQNGTQLFRCGAVWNRENGEGYTGRMVDTLGGRRLSLVIVPSDQDGEKAPEFRVLTEVELGDGKTSLTEIGSLWTFEYDGGNGLSGTIYNLAMGRRTKIVLFPAQTEDQGAGDAD